MIITFLEDDWFSGVRCSEASIKVLTEKKFCQFTKMADPLTSSSKLIGVEMENRGQENLPVGVKFHLHAFSGLYV